MDNLRHTSSNNAEQRAACTHNEIDAGFSTDSNCTDSNSSSFLIPSTNRCGTVLGEIEDMLMAIEGYETSTKLDQITKNSYSDKNVNTIVSPLNCELDFTQLYSSTRRTRRCSPDLGNDCRYIKNNSTTNVDTSPAKDNKVLSEKVNSTVPLYQNPNSSAKSSLEQPSGQESPQSDTNAPSTEYICGTRRYIPRSVNSLDRIRATLTKSTELGEVSSKESSTPMLNFQETKAGAGSILKELRKLLDKDIKAYKDIPENFYYRTDYKSKQGTSAGEQKPSSLPDVNVDKKHSAVSTPQKTHSKELIVDKCGASFSPETTIANTGKEIGNKTENKSLEPSQTVVLKSTISPVEVTQVVNNRLNTGGTDACRGQEGDTFRSLARMVSLDGMYARDTKVMDAVVQNSRRCEEKVQTLEESVRRLQNKLNRTMQVNKAKDFAIEQLKAAWKRLADHWEEVELHRIQVTDSFKTEMTRFEKERSELQERCRLSETQLSKSYGLIKAAYDKILNLQNSETCLVHEVQQLKANNLKEKSSWEERLAVVMSENKMQASEYAKHLTAAIMKKM